MLAFAEQFVCKHGHNSYRRADGRCSQCSSISRVKWRRNNVEKARTTARLQYHARGEEWRENRRRYNRAVREKLHLAGTSEYQNKRTTVLARKHGVSKEEYITRLARQDNKCAACRGEFKSSKDVNFDHDHTTGMRREFLCGACNRALGILKDSAERCDLLAAYRRRF